jgi:hypothetical protein
VLTPDDAREMARALPEVVEQDHHGMASFRLRGTVLATVPDQRTLRVMLDEDAIRTAVAENDAVCSPVHWGQKLSCVAVDLTAAEPELVRELLTDAWRRRAPRALRSSFEDLA